MFYFTGRPAPAGGRRQTMRKHKPRPDLHAAPPATLEGLEPRRLFAWGAFPQLIDQDLAVSRYPQFDGSGQTIAFIDTGVDYTQPQLAGKYLGGIDLIDS